MVGLINWRKVKGVVSNFRHYVVGTFEKLTIRKMRRRLGDCKVQILDGRGSPKCVNKVKRQAVEAGSNRGFSNET